MCRITFVSNQLREVEISARFCLKTCLIYKCINLCQHSSRQSLGATGSQMPHLIPGKHKAQI